MELQLSLALPIHTPTNGFDLNRNFEYEPEDHLSGFGCSTDIKCHYKRKRGFTPMAFDHGSVPTQMFPLVSWNGDPNEEDGSDEDGRKRNSDSSNGEEHDGETNFIKGWPPINSWRKKMFLEHQGGAIMDKRRVERGRGGRGRNSKFVKVKMEGVAIGRKINLNLYHSYQMLTMTLINMFPRYLEDESDDNEDEGYTLLYQYKEGNWLLAGEVQWQTFIESAQRVKVRKNDGACS